MREKTDDTQPVFAAAVLTEPNDENSENGVRAWIRASFENLEAEWEKGRTV